MYLKNRFYPYIYNHPKNIVLIVFFTIKNKLKDYYNINNYTNYIKVLTPDEEFKKDKNYKKDSQLLSF